VALTNIGQQKTPGRPTEVTFAPELGLPSDSQEVVCIGRAASGATGTNTVITVSNAGDIDAGTAEANTKFGEGSELAKMVIAAIEANQGRSTYPPIKALVLASDATTIPDAAQTALRAGAKQISFLASPFDLDADSVNRDLLKTLALTLSGAQRVQNNQFGSFGVGACFAEATPADLFAMDTQFLIGIYKRDSAPTKSLGETAARAAATMAANGIPFNPQDDLTLLGEAAPVNIADNLTVGAGLDSETVLSKGWTPLWVKPNGEVAFVRTVTARLSPDGSGSPLVTAYYDVQDFATLYFWRKTLYTRFSQPDFKSRKASAQAATDIKGEAIRLAVTFEDEEMFQAVGRLARKFKVERNASDRHRFDVFTPVNVVPGLHVIATNVQATTEFDVITL
jgi:phage tail sheath gpL-like